MTERVDHMLAALPRGRSVDAAPWARRHRLLLWLLAAHLPGLALVGILAHGGWVHTAGEMTPVAIGLLVGLAARSRVVRSAGVTVGLVASASLLVHFTGGMPQAHFHYFVVLGFIALYQDWRPYLIAIASVIVGHLLIEGWQSWTLLLVHSGFVIAACAAHVVFWKQAERQQLAAEEYYAQLYEGERAIVANLRQAQRVKDELLGVVGHEFRTPLTAIHGFARTLDARYDRMDPDAVRTCTQAIEREAKHLTRMVSNLLWASEEIQPGAQDRCRLSEIAAIVVGDVTETAPAAARAVQLHVPPDHWARISAEAARRLLFNLLDNAVKFAIPDSEVRVTTRLEDDMVVMEVTNVGTPITPADRTRIFDAFVQADSSDTRRYGGMGLGLHIARRIATAYGGRIGAYCEGPIVIFRVWLPVATPGAVRGKTPTSVVLPVAAHVG